MAFHRARIWVTLGSILMFAGASAEAQQPAPTASPAQPATVQVDASSVVGSAVRAPDGRDLGKVSSLMLEPREGRITTVVITMGGRLGVGGETLSVPWSAVRVAQDGRNIVLTVDQQILESAPSASPRTSEPARPAPPKQ